MAYRFVSFLGLLLMIGIAWGLSENRRKFPVRTVLWGVGLQLALGTFFLWGALKRQAFLVTARAVSALQAASDHGAKFLFGELTSEPVKYGAAMAFSALPVVIFVSALAGILYHYGVIQALVRGMAWLMRRTMRISGAEALASALLVFFGIEAGTAIGEYLRKMTRSELFVVMTAFMATIAGSVLVLYVRFGAEAGHLVVASLMSAPAAVAIAKVMVPETEEPLTAAGAEFDPPRESVNLIDAAARGAGQGLKLALNIGAMLIAFVGLVFLVNLVLGNASLVFFRQPLTLERLMGWCFCPLAWAMGVPWDDIPRVGELLGIKTVLNEFLAYERMSKLRETLQPRSVIIATYALCGFANLGSIAILVGGLSGIDPERRSLFARLGWKALVAGTLAGFMTACVAGMLY